MTDKLPKVGEEVFFDLDQQIGDPIIEGLVTKVEDVGCGDVEVTVIVEFLIPIRELTDWSGYNG